MNIQLTAEGYLQDQAKWDKEVAEWFAAQQGLELTVEHWEIIKLLRNFYAEYNISPTSRAIVNAVKAQLGPEKGNSIYLLRLFPAGAAKQANLIAGLPKANCTI